MGWLNQAFAQNLYIFIEWMEVKHLLVELIEKLKY